MHQSVNCYRFKKNSIESTPSISSNLHTESFTSSSGIYLSDVVTESYSSYLIESPPNTATITQSPALSLQPTLTSAVQCKTFQHDLIITGIYII